MALLVYSNGMPGILLHMVSGVKGGLQKWAVWTGLPGLASLDMLVCAYLNNV